MDDEYRIWLDELKETLLHVSSLFKLVGAEGLSILEIVAPCMLLSIFQMKEHGLSKDFISTELKGFFDLLNEEVNER